MDWGLVGDQGEDNVAASVVSSAVEESLDEDAVVVLGGAIAVEGDETRVLEEREPVFGD